MRFRVVAGVVSLWPLSVHADDIRGGARLAWVRGAGAEGCVDQEALASHVTRLLGEDPFRREPAQFFEAVAERNDGVWRAQVYVRTAQGRLSGSRVLTDTSATCDALVSAVALTVSLGIDPAARPRIPPAAVDLETPSPSPPPRATVHAIAPISVDLVGAAGLLPGFAPGVGLEGVPLHAGRFSLQVGADFLPEVTESITTLGSFAFGATAFTLAGCWDLLGSSRTRVALCGGVMAGVTHALVYDLQPEPSRERWWQGFTVGARWDLRIAGPLVLSARMELVPMTVRARFDVNSGATTVFEQSPVTALGSIGLGLTIR